VLNNISLLTDIATNAAFHARGTTYFANMEGELLTELEGLYENNLDGRMLLGEIGEIYFPYFSFGNLDSRKLFGLDEIILFAFYYANQKRYKSILDLGANIGLHSLVLAKLAFVVTSYEPDEIHCLQYENIMNLNNLQKQKVTKKAIGVDTNPVNFTRVRGNTTGSFISDAKSDVYGEIESFDVEVDDIEEVLNSTHFDLVKMDVEGYEATLLSRISVEHYRNTDFMLEVGSSKNAAIIFDLVIDKKLNAFSQKNNWNRVERIEDMPLHHSQGSLFIGNAQGPKWS
jgi:FkbM family methyltransferase